jgi:uncharacterized protein YehS (DUF1456 family)
MNNNDVLRSICLVLNLNDAATANIFKLAGQDVDPATITQFLKNENEGGYLDCNNHLMTLFLDGLISHRRGKSDKNPSPSNDNFPPLTNNVIIKKLRIAFNLKEDDLIELMSLADYEVNKNELGAFFRKPGHKHYRACPDEFLMGFLVGLTYHQWH